jgi:hypothetical protein
MAAPEGLPLAARRAAWDALWRILLAPHASDGPGPSGPADTKALTGTKTEVSR